MRMRDLLLTVLAVGAMTFCSVDLSMAQQKKKQMQSATHPYKECCEKALGRYFLQDGKAHCWTSQQQTEALYQCSQQRGIRIISNGSITM
jgi:hypothetical protein